MADHNFVQVVGTACPECGGHLDPAIPHKCVKPTLTVSGMTKPDNTEDELEKLGENINPELAALLNDLHSAERQVEADGSSYRHMPDYFKARGAIVAYIQANYLSKTDVQAAIGEWEPEVMPVADQVGSMYRNSFRLDIRQRLNLEERTNTNE